MTHRLLLADDSVTIQRVIELTFADEDVKVVAVSDGDQAIARLNAEPPDIVLADIGMPGKTGYEVAAYVKRTPRLAHIPVSPVPRRSRHPKTAMPGTPRRGAAYLLCCRERRPPR